VEGGDDGAQSLIVLVYCSFPSSPFWLLSQIQELVASTGYFY